MQGYKALNTDMSPKYGDMTYEIGKKYTITGELKMCKNGFHFCKHLEDVENYYEIVKSRIFEVEAEGEIIDKDIKSCAESITLIKELSKEEIHQYFEDNQERILRKLKKSWYYRKALADQGFCLDKLIYDKDPDVRAAVARQGYGLDILIYDENPNVRIEVALQGYNLNVLVKDESPFVRIAVAEQGYGLDVLIHDEDSQIRAEVAAHGYGLDVLIEDADTWVREEVARQGYGLDILVNDNSPLVREIVARQGYGLNVLINDKSAIVRAAVAEQGYGLNVLINDKESLVHRSALNVQDILIRNKKYMIDEKVKEL